MFLKRMIWVKFRTTWWARKFVVSLLRFFSNWFVMLTVFEAKCTNQLSETNVDEIINNAKMFFVRRLQQLRKSRCERQDVKFELLNYSRRWNQRNIMHKFIIWVNQLTFSRAELDWNVIMILMIKTMKINDVFDSARLIFVNRSFDIKL